MRINGYLRGHDAPDETREAQIKRLDSAIAKHTLDRDTLLYRGGSGFRAHDWPNQVGKEITLPAYTSTTGRATIASMFRNYAADPEDRVTYKILAPKGTHALPVHLALENNEEYHGEREFILPRGSKFAVDKVAKHTVWLRMIPNG